MNVDHDQESGAEMRIYAEHLGLRVRIWDLGQEGAHVELDGVAVLVLNHLHQWPLKLHLGVDARNIPNAHPVDSILSYE